MGLKFVYKIRQNQQRFHSNKEWKNLSGCIKYRFKELVSKKYTIPGETFSLKDIATSNCMDVRQYTKARSEIFKYSDQPLQLSAFLQYQYTLNKTQSN